MLDELSGALVWATRYRWRYVLAFIALMNVAMIAAMSVWTWPFAVGALLALVPLNQTRAMFIKVPGFIAACATGFFALQVAGWGALGLSRSLPGWSHDIVGVSMVLIGGVSILCHVILTLRYGSIYEEPGHPPKAPP